MKKISYNVTCICNNKKNKKNNNLIKMAIVVFNRKERECYENVGAKKINFR